jgi:hypothetical protein
MDDLNILNNVADLTADQVLAAADKLQMLAEPINGPNSFNLEVAAYGYISREERLVIPGALKSKISTDIATLPDLNIVQVMGIAMYNYVRMKRRSLSDDHALFLALYRARLVKLGYLLRNKEDRKVTVDEVDYPDNIRDPHTQDYASTTAYKTAFDRETDDEGRLLAAMQHSSIPNFKKFLSLVFQKPNIIAFVTMCATQLAAATYLVFRQMGHHYKADLDGKYNILWKATTLDTPTFMPANSEIHRSAIHSFGVYTLHEKFYEHYNNGRLAETFMDRADVTPCGVAVINTCWASIKLMQSLPIWSGLYQAYKTQIDQLQKQASLLSNAKESIKYHKNARLFGVTREILDPTSAYALAPVAKGFLESMEMDADIKRQKALDKRANQNPLAVTLISSVIITVFNKIQNEGNIMKALPATGESRVEELEAS